MERRLNSTFLVSVIFVAAVLSAYAEEVSGHPDRAHFIREVLDAAPTAVTPKFDDYTKGSYHIDKLDLVQGIEEAAKSSATKVRALVVVGPIGPLWEYTILAFFEDRDSIRVNLVQMPHARITGKGTTTLSEVEFKMFIQKLTSFQSLTKGDPLAIKVDRDRSLEFAYDVLIANWTPLGRLLYYADLQQVSETDDARELLWHIQVKTWGITPTYPEKKNPVESSTKE